MTHPSDTPTVAPGGGGIDALIEAMYEAGREYASARELAAHDLASHHDKRNRDESEDDFREARDRLRAALLASQRDGALIDELEAWTKGDQTICPPGNHGGGVGNWLVAREDDARGDRHGNWCDEYEAPTLRGALSAMSASRPSSPPVAPEPTYLCAQCHLNGSGRFLWTEALGCANPECVTKTHPHFAAAPEPENTR